jgi:hypothetical protein
MTGQRKIPIFYLYLELPMVEDIHTTNNNAMKLNSTPELTYTHILNKIVNLPRLSLITKARNRCLDAFTI